MAGLSNVVEVAAGQRHSLALGRDELGIGAVCASLTSVAPPCFSHVPVRVQGLSGIVAIAAGSVHSLALGRDGTLWAWGANDTSALGVRSAGTCGSTPCSATPLLLSGPTGVDAFGGGDSYTVALKHDGSVWIWGLGQLVPARLLGLSGAIAIAVGVEHYLVLLRDGTVRAWGQNTAGQLGTGTRGDSGLRLNDPPVPVAGLHGVVAIAAGDDPQTFRGHSLALTREGSLWGWGAFPGSGTRRSLVPVLVSGLQSVSAIAAGNMHSLAVTRDGVLWAWGTNDRGQLGIGTEVSDAPTPVRVPQLGSVRR